MEKRELIRVFTDEAVTACIPVGCGHINDSYHVCTIKNEYILQRLNAKLFAGSTKALERNYILYRDACRENKNRTGEWEVPHWLSCSAGSFLYTDEEGACWRMYEYIKGKTLTAPFDTEDIKAFGNGLSKLHFILEQMKETPQGVLSELHDTRGYYRDYEKIRESADESLHDRMLEAIIERKAQRILDISLPGMSVIHADAKIGNALFRGGSMISMIDLDTIMQGARLLDIADALRSCCMSGGAFDNTLADAFVKAYQGSGYARLSKEECEALPEAFKLICYELGLRYYTDHLNGGIYFKQEYPGQDLDKAKKLLLG